MLRNSQNGLSNFGLDSFLLSSRGIKVNSDKSSLDEQRHDSRTWKWGVCKGTWRSARRALFSKIDFQRQKYAQFVELQTSEGEQRLKILTCHGPIGIGRPQAVYRRRWSSVLPVVRHDSSISNMPTFVFGIADLSEYNPRHWWQVSEGESRTKV